MSHKAEHEQHLTLSQPVICIVGPTASGKTALAQLVALHLGGEVVSADSMQIYQGMDVGTGKPSLSERIVPHHGFDLISPGQPYSAALFQEYARACFASIDKRNKRVILCGGTGFYVRAALDDYHFPAGEIVDNTLRDSLTLVAEQEGPQALWARLREIDAPSANLIAANDVRRVVRAFELLEAKTSYAQQREKLATIPQIVPAIFIGLAVDPATLNARIDRRVDDMVASGLVNEVQSLLDTGFREGITAPQAIGYKEIVAGLEGEISLDEAINRIKIATHRYAKRQRTWFRKEKRIHWIEATSTPTETQLKQALSIIASHDV